MSNQSTNEASAPETGDRVQRARQRRARDDQWLVQAKRGDADAYRHLVAEWSPGAFDRALHRGADERSAAEAMLRTFTSLQSQLVDDDTSFGARVMGAIERDVPARPRSLGKANRGAKRAAERLTRGTDPAALGADPSISVMLWDALDVLGDRARDITDLHWRHGLASDEIAAATGESIFRVDDIIRKAPQGLSAALRTRLLWAGGKPDHDELTRDLKANNVRQFDSTAVRVIHGHLRACSVRRSRSLIALPAIEIFEGVPLVAVPADVERRVTGTSWAPFVVGAAAVAAIAEPAFAEPAPETVPESESTQVEPESVEPELYEPGPLEPQPELQPEPEPQPEPEREPVTEVTAAAVTAAPIETRERSEPSGTVIGGTVAAAGAAAAAFLGAKADASPLTSPRRRSRRRRGGPRRRRATGTPGARTRLRIVAATGRDSGGRAEPQPRAPGRVEHNPVLPRLRPRPSILRNTGPAHEPVASRATDRDDARRRWLIPACIGAAAIRHPRTRVGVHPRR